MIRAAPDAAGRAAHAVRHGGYLSLATAGRDGAPWVAQLQYAWRDEPLSLLFGSAVASRHAGHLRASGRAAAAISLLPSAHGLLDGVQLEGPCAPLAGARLEALRGPFYAQLFPEPDERAAYELPASRLAGDAPQRLFELTVRRLWLLDLDRWEADGICTRTAVDPAAVSGLLAAAPADGR